MIRCTPHYHLACDCLMHLLSLLFFHAIQISYKKLFISFYESAERITKNQKDLQIYLFPYLSINLFLNIISMILLSNQFVAQPSPQISKLQPTSFQIVLTTRNPMQSHRLKHQHTLQLSHIQALINEFRIYLAPNWYLCIKDVCN